MEEVENPVCITKSEIISHLGLDPKYLFPKNDSL